MDFPHREYRFAPTEITCSAKTTFRKQANAQKNQHPFPITIQLEKMNGAGTSSTSDKTTGQTSDAYCQPENCWFVPSFVGYPRSVVWELSLRQRNG